MFAYATEPLRTALSRKPVSLPRGNLIGLYVDHVKAVQFPCIFGFWCISTTGAGLWCCSLGYPVMHRWLQPATGVASSARTPIIWKRRMPGPTRCAESDSFYACALLFKLAFVRIKPAWRGNKPKATPYAHKTWRGKPLMGGRESSPLRKGHARFHFIAGCWVDSKKNFLFFPIDIRRRSRTRRRRRRYLFDPSFWNKKEANILLTQESCLNFAETDIFC